MYRGMARGMKVYDYIADVPDQLTVSGEKYIVLNPPQDLIDNGALFVKKTNPLTIFTFIGLCIIITLVGTITILALQQIGYILRGRPGELVDPNLFEGGNGSVCTRDPETGIWTCTPPTGDLLIWAIVAIFIIGIVILILLNRKRLFGPSEGGKSGSAGSTKKKKDKEET